MSYFYIIFSLSIMFNETKVKAEKNSTEQHTNFNCKESSTKNWDKNCVYFFIHISIF